MKRVLSILGGVFAVAIIILIIAVPITNNNVAKETAKRLVDTPLPEQTEYIESAYLAGKLVGNGNGMQYFGAILVKSELSLEELNEYYKDRAQNDWEFIVAKQAGNNIAVIEHGELSFQSDIVSDGYYIVYSWGNSNNIFSELDLRGH